MKSLRSFITFMTCCLAIGTMAAQAIKTNTVYLINNYGTSGRSMAIPSSGQNIVTSATNINDSKQLWLAIANNAGTGFYFRNVANGSYLTSSRQTSASWTAQFADTPDDSKMLISVTDKNGNSIIRATTDTNGYGFAHNAAGNSVVCWESNNLNTQWNFVEVEKTDAELKEIMARFQNTADEIARASQYQQHLQALFNDYACTDLKPGLDLSTDLDYAALSPTLQLMVDKIASKDWSETNGNWNSKYAQKYRVQYYEPYSEGSAAAGMAGIQAYTNMNNPTGILANANELIYIMVNSDVPEGATLYISGAPDGGMYNSTTSGTPLHKGLNIMLCNENNSHLFVYYTVATVKNGKPSEYKVTEFDPIKIHIEGGRLNGFFNSIGDELYTPDTREDYEYTVARASHVMYDLVGKYVILHFFLNDTPNTVDDTQLQLGVRSSLDPSINKSGKLFDPAKILERWDNMCFAERMLMGIQSDSDILKEFNQGNYTSIVGDTHTVGGYTVDLGFQYSDYFNNRMMGITLQAKGLYMNATAWRTAYAPSTISAILTLVEDGMWGPAHEYGHMNQTPMRIAGTTEESNNVFSNVSMYYNEKTTSRSDFMSSQLKIFNQNRTFLDHGTWGTTRMFWQLWLYYHATKHNTRFYPRLYELLRKNPLKRDLTTRPGKLSPKTDLLHFAKMCCVAAGEDLTNFFTAWGFFVPQDNYHIDDYDVYDCILTPEDIAEVKDEIASWQLKENNAIILIDDRPGSDRVSHGEFPKDKGGDVGGLKDFSQSSAPSGSFNFTIEENTVNVTGDGQGGVGFLVFDNDGNLIGFSNSYSFELAPDAVEKLLSGEARIDVVGSDNTVAQVTNTALDGTAEEKTQLLGNLISQCNELLSMEDESESFIGHLYPDSCSNLKAQLVIAQEILENAAGMTGQELTQSYLELSDVYYALLNNTDARIAIKPGDSYRIINNYYTTKVLSAAGQTAVSANIVNDETAIPFEQQWIIEQATAGAANEYYLKDMATGLYLNAHKKYNVALQLSETPQKFTLITIENGIYAFAPDNATSYAVHLNSGGSILHWYSTSSSTQWNIKHVNTAEYIAVRQALKEKTQQAMELLNQAGTYDGVDRYKMTFDNSQVSTNAEYTGPNTGDRLTTWQVLFDDNISTYFHSDYSGNNTPDNLDHYIQLKAADGDYFRSFILSYTTRNNTSTGTNPSAIKILASADGNEWSEVYTVTSGLLKGAAVTNVLPEITVENGTKYIRFMVNESGDKRGGHAYFALSELKISNRHDLSATPSADYPKVKETHMTNVGRDVYNSNEVYDDAAATLDQLQQALASLTASHNELLGAMQGIQPVEGIELNPAEISILLNETAEVDILLTPDDATDKTYEFTVEPEGVIEVKKSETADLKLEIKPLTIGQAAVNVRTLDGSAISAQTRINVLPVPLEAIEISAENNVMKVGDNPMTLTALLTPADATSPALQWSVTNVNLGQIIPSADGTTALLYPLAMGKIDVTVQLADNAEISATTTIKILPDVPVSSIALFPTELSVPLNAQGVTISAEVSPVDAFDPALKWESSDHDVAIVNENTGELTLIGEGTTTITASSTDGTEVSGACQLTVTEPVAQGLYIIPAESSIEVGASVTLATGYEPADADAPQIEWSTQDLNIVHIDANGTVVGVAEGQAIVTASAIVAGRTISAEAKITVTPATIRSLTLSATTITIENGSTTTLTAYYEPNTTDPQLLWSVDDPTIVDYIETDDPCTIELKALDDGTTTVNLQSGNNPDLLATCLVNVMEGEVKSIKLVIQNTLIELTEGSHTIYASYEPSNLAMPALIWSSSNENVATVSSIGGLGAEIIPLKGGTTTITVSHAEKPELNDAADFEVIDSTTAISRLLGDDASTPIDVYTLNGTAVKIAARAEDLKDLHSGFYIVRQGGKTVKIYLRN